MGGQTRYSEGVIFSRDKTSNKIEELTGASKFYRFGAIIFFALQVFALYAADELPPSLVKRISLPELLKGLESQALFRNEAEALRRVAKAKVDEVEMKRWLTVFEMKAFGGVIPDVELTDPNNVNSVRSYDFESDLSFNHMGGFFKMEVDAVQPIWTFGKISNYQDAAKLGFTLADWEQKKRLSEFRFLVKRAYYTLLYSMESLSTLKDVEAKLNEAAEKVEKQLMKDAENVSETDLLKIKVFQADVRNRMLDAERGRRLSRSALSEMLQLSGEWEVDEDKLNAEEVTGLKKEEVISAALRATPQIQQLETLIKIKESERLAKRAELFPTIFLAGRLNYAVAPGREDIKNPFLVDEFNKFDLGAVLGLKLDLGAHRSLQAMESIQAEIDRFKAQKAQLLTKVKLETEKSFEEALSAMNGIAVNEDGFRAARSWLTSAGLAFNLGTAETKDILESFAAYFKARADLARSIYNLDLSLSELSDLSGVEVVSRLK